jgi:hypothetical protein
MVISNDEQCSSIWCSVPSTSTEHFNFAEPEHVLEHLTPEHRALGLNIKTDKNYLKSKLLFIRYKRLISKINELLDLKNLDIVFNALHTDRISLKI